MAKKKGKPGSKKDNLWAEAKKRCRLNNEDIRIVKELGLNPRSLIKNIHQKTNNGSYRLKTGFTIYKEKEMKRLP